MSDQLTYATKILNWSRNWVRKYFVDVFFITILFMAAQLTNSLYRTFPDDWLNALACQVPFFLTFAVWRLYDYVSRAVTHMRKTADLDRELMDALIRDTEKLAEAHNKLTTMVYDLAAVVREMEKEGERGRTSNRSDSDLQTP
jgi:hypothetical protein